MFKVRRLPNPSAKITGSVADMSRGGIVKVIMRVQTPGHVPAGATVRSRIDETLFTAEFDAALVDQIAADPDVLTISPAQKVRPVGSR